MNEPKYTVSEVIGILSQLNATLGVLQSGDIDMPYYGPEHGEIEDVNDLKVELLEYIMSTHRYLVGRCNVIPDQSDDAAEKSSEQSDTDDRIDTICRCMPRCDCPAWLAVQERLRKSVIGESVDDTPADPIRGY